MKLVAFIQTPAPSAATKIAEAMADEHHLVSFQDRTFDLMTGLLDVPDSRVLEKDEPLESLHGKTIRETMDSLNDWTHGFFGEDIGIARVKSESERWFAHHCENPDTGMVIIDDLRTPEQLQFVVDNNGLVVRLTNNGSSAGLLSGVDAVEIETAGRDARTLAKQVLQLANSYFVAVAA